jgi:SulP family sulfate permease
MIAILDAYKNGLLNRNNWIKNLVAGVIVGVVALPLAMAFAIASGAKPEQGLYTSIVAGIAVGLFGGSRIQIAGPTGAFIVILANITAHYGISGLQLASLMAGFILIGMGALKLGDVIKFIPDPVIVGFTSGIGVIIFLGAWKDFFGLSLSLPLNAPFYKKLFALFHALPHLDITTTLLALLSFTLVLLTPKLFKRIPGPLVALVVASLLQPLFHFTSVATLGSTFGGIPQHLPSFHLPSMHFSTMMDLFGSAFTIALLGAIESLLSATAADGMAGTRHHSNQELIGQGIANILSPLFGGFAATGAIARTATNVRNGGNCAISPITHSIFLLLVLVLLAPLAIHVPLCCLAAILFVVSYNMSDVPHFIYMLKHAPSYDIIVMVITFLLTIFTNLVLAVNIGIVLALLFFVSRMYQTSNVLLHSHDELKKQLPNLESLPKDLFVYSIQGPLFFGVAEKVEHTLLTTNELPKTIIFRLNEVPFMDITGLETLREIVQRFHKNGVKLYICEANLRVSKKLLRLGLTSWLEDTSLTDSFAVCYQKAIVTI